MHSPTAWIAERPIAHRGLHDVHRPENSLAAFEASANAGYPIELDVHVSADDVAVVFHDADLYRMTGARGLVATRTAAELGALSLLATAEHIPTLSEVAARVAGRVPLLVEVKNPGRVGRVERAVAESLGAYRGEWAVQSFNPWSVMWFRRNMPAIPRGQLAGDFVGTPLALYKRALLRRLALCRLVQPAFIAYELRCLPAVAATRWRRRGLPLVAWTVHTEAERVRAEAVADNYIFEGIYPNSLARNPSSSVQDFASASSS